MPETKPTLASVARRAGVSTATVSRCLNEVEKVGPTTRARVMGAVEELGYLPHFGGRALASNRTKTIGAVIPTMDNAIFARGLQAFQSALAEADLTLLVASSDYEPEREFEQIKALVSRGADGLLLIGSLRPERTRQFLRRRNIPTVLAWAYQGGGAGHFAGFDNIGAARAMAAHVLALGHRHVAMIAGRTAFNDRARDRIVGVRAALAEAGRNGGDLAVAEAPYSIDAGGRAFETLMAARPRPTAIFCGNDVLAVGAVLRARQLGLDVPGTVSISGFDNIDLARVTDPGLTTVHVPHRRMGRAAAELLLALQDGRSPASIRLDTHIVERGSVGPPGNG